MRPLPEKRKFSLDIIIVLSMAFFWNVGVYFISKLITKSWHHYDMTLSADEYVPFLPWTVLIYLGCYLFWAVNYYMCANQSNADRDRFFCADFLAKAICLIIFIALPTTNVRPIIGDTKNVFNFLMSFLYKIDTADNLFPSIHCLVSWLCWVGVRKRKDVSVFYRYFSLAVAVIICITTLTTRQHVVVDVFAGVALAELCYYIADFAKVKNVYSTAFTFILRIFKKENV